MTAETPATCGNQLADWTCTLPVEPHPDRRHRDDDGHWWTQTPPAVSSSAPADRAELRDRIAEALANADGLELGETESFPFLHEGQVSGYRRRADAVLAVLPAPAEFEFRGTAEIQTAALTEAADWFERDGRSIMRMFGYHAALLLRSLADEAPQPETQAATVAAEVVAAMHVPCSFPPCDTGPGEPCDTHERLWAHAEGEHELCGPECPADDAQQHEPGVVAYRSSGARVLRCLTHAPVDLTGFTPVTSEDLPDGGICTHPDCGVDVLIPQLPEAAEGAQQ
jgi:hypothetical protein